MVKITKIKLIIEGKKIKDVNESILALRKKDPDFKMQSSTFVMLQDAKKTKGDIYKLEKPIKSRKEIPKFIFL